MVLYKYSPLKKYQDKIQARNWGDFANKMIRTQDQKRRYDPKSVMLLKLL